MRLLTALWLLCCLPTAAQTKKAIVSGIITNEEGYRVAGASVTILGKKNGVASTDSGTFSIQIPAKSAIALVFSHTGYESQQKNFFMNAGEQEFITIRLKSLSATLEEVLVTDNRQQNENSLVKINPRNAALMPGATSGVEGLIKTLVGSNNELTSQYNVRGGNFDENLVYINDFEIFRPYLVSSGQQEGLSIINPEMTRSVLFYTGGFQARYGDKMSSVLDIQYKKPVRFGGTAYAGLLEQEFHLEGISKNKKLTYIAGTRNKSNRNLLSSQPTTGAYIPSSSDIQAYFTYAVNKKVQVDVLGIYSQARFTFFPETVKKTASVFSPLYSANLGLDVYFEGQERDRYTTAMAGTTLSYQVNDSLQLKWLVSRFENQEQENFDIGGAYLFGDRSFDNTSSSFGLITNPLGSGYYQDYARNKLKIVTWNIAHRGVLEKEKHYLQWGLGVEHVQINDRLNQWQYQDSAGYNIPYTPGNIDFMYSVNSRANLNVMRYSGFVQDNVVFHKKNMDIHLQGGIRFNYNNLNNEFLVSPRVQVSIKPAWKQNIVFKGATGIYQQPPFYRELRDYNGVLNTDIKAQKSWQIVTGADYSFTGPGKRPMRITAEAFYKLMWDVVPYDIDNVKIRYYGKNNATAYARGVEFRLFGELVDGAESWISLGIMRTRENLFADYYQKYYNAAGELITASTTDKVVADSTRQYIGPLRRPSDRLITLGLFLQDYLTTNKNFKVHLNVLYGSNMSYSIPNNPRFRSGLTIEPYIRADIGFSAQLLKEKSKRRRYDPMRGIDNIWLSLEIFNVIDRANTISYQLIKDFSNTTFAIPNRLTPRLLNVKLLTRF